MGRKSRPTKIYNAKRIKFFIGLFYKMVKLSTRRIYSSPIKGEGLVVLVDRLWPRGIKKDKVDIWIKDIAPSTKLRGWFDHKPNRWSEFKKRYIAELKDNPNIDKLVKLVKRRNVCLVYATKDIKHNNAIVLYNYLKKYVK
jgi:uncharacterized protein YeaO (DUF488 family)